MTDPTPHRIRQPFDAPRKPEDQTATEAVIKRILGKADEVNGVPIAAFNSSI